VDAKRARFEAEVLPYFDAAYRFARWLARSPGDADDLVQEAILRAYRGFDGLRGNDVKAWLLTIVRNCHATAWREERRRAHVPLPEEDQAADADVLVAPGQDPERDSIRRDHERTLERLIAELPAEQREVLVLREIEEMSYREIAAVAKLPIGTVMSRLARAREALKVLWLRRIEGEPSAVR